MKTTRIIDFGRGPQIEGSRLTVMDVFYYLHRGYEFDFIRQAIPSLTREEFEAVVEFVREHHDELVERDRRVEEFHKRGMEAQHARGGIFAEGDETATTEERVDRLKDKLNRKAAEKNGTRRPD